MSIGLDFIKSNTINNSGNIREFENLKSAIRSFGNLNDSPLEQLYEWMSELHAVINRLPVSKKTKQHLRSSANDIVTVQVSAIKDICEDITCILDEKITELEAKEEQLAATRIEHEPPINTDNPEVRTFGQKLREFFRSKKAQQ
jgi:hypothetical protein